MRLAGLLTLFLVAGNVAFAAPAREYTLKNGLRVILKRVEGVPIVSVWSVIHAGSANEHTGISGAAHWCEHMCFKGNRKYSRDDLKNLLERVGGAWNGYTWLDQTAYHETVPSDSLDLALDIEAQRLSSSLFDPEAVEAERTVILSELRMGENDPENLLDIATTAAAIKAHPYHWPTIGWQSDIEGMSRRNLYGFYRRYYCPNNATLVVVGDFDEEPALRLIRHKFGGLKTGLENKRLHTVEPEQLGERRIKLKKGGATPYILIAYHTPTVDSGDFFPLHLLNAVLGGAESINLSNVAWRGQASRSSRLYKGLVDAGLAAKAGSLYLPTKYPCLFYVYATAGPGVELSDLEKGILGIMEGLSEGEIPGGEFMKAVTQQRSRFIYDSDSVTEQAGMLGFFDSIDAPDFMEKYLSRLAEVRREDLARVAGKYFGEKNRTVGWYVPAGEAVKESAAAAPRRGDGPRSRGPAGYRASADPSLGARVRRLLPWKEKGKSRGPGGRGTDIAGLRWNRVSVRVPSSVRIHATRKVLPNGLTLVVRENNISPSVAARVDIAAGSARDPAGMSGIANFTAKMLDRGNVNMSADLIAEVLDSSGTELRINCGRDRSSIEVQMLKEKLPMVVEMLSQMVREPVFPSREIERVRGRIEVSIEEALHDTMRVAVDELYGLVYPPGQPYRHRVEGDRATVASVKREDLVRFHDTRYGPGAVTIVLSGDVKRKEAEKLVEKYFGGWEAHRLAEEPTFLIPPLPVRTRWRKTTIADKTQEDIALGFRGIKRSNPDYYALKVMNTILGRFGMGGRLGRVIREERGMAYYVFSGFTALENVGLFIVRAGVNPAHVDEAVAEIRAGMQRMIDDGATPEELRESTQYIIRSIPRQLETNDRVAAALADVQFHGLGLDYFQRLPDLIGKVSLEDVQRVAGQYLHPGQYDVSLAGPVE